MGEKLFPYQIEGIKWLTDKRFALLADEMGLGKSVQAIKAADQLNLINILVICMAVGRTNWQREFEKWSTVSRAVSVLREGKDRPLPSGIVITSYDYLQRNLNVLKRPWDVVIFDESHALKNPRAKRTKAALGKDGVIRQSKRIWFLSGTPAPNNFSEMWPTLYTIGATSLPFDEFTKRYCFVQDTEYGPIIRGNRMDRVPEMKSLLKDVMLRRKKEKGMLPDLLYQDFVVDAGPVDFSQHKEFFDYTFPIDRRDEVKAILKSQEELLSLTLQNIGNFTLSTQYHTIKTLEGLAQSVSTLRRYNGLQKIKDVVESVAFELENGDYDKIVLFAVHRDVIESLRLGLMKFNPVTVYGGKTDEGKQKAVDKFQKTKKHQVFIGNIQAAGTTITLTRAHNVLFVEQDWVPGNNAQAMMRVHRIGQTKPVLVRFAMIRGSIDEKISRVLKRKSIELATILDEPESPFQDEEAESKTLTQSAKEDFCPVQKGTSVDILQMPPPPLVKHSSTGKIVTPYHEDSSGHERNPSANSNIDSDDIFS